MRQLIIARKDLQMSPGKLAAQCCHASLAFLTDPIGMGEGVEPVTENGEVTGYRAAITLDKATYEEWFDGSFTKTICGAKNRNQLLKAKTIAEELGLVENRDFFLIRDACHTELEPEETAKLAGSMQVIREKMRERTHFYQKELVQNAFIGFLLDLGNIMLSKKDRLIRPTLSRKEELFEQFLQLLFEHCKEQHVVTFYAERLFITPQYLSLILKELTGKSANKWIDDALIVEAKILLKAPQATVQQVADILHFSDQSTFGKFFKKHMGISPMEYRKS